MSGPFTCRCACQGHGNAVPCGKSGARERSCSCSCHEPRATESAPAPSALDAALAAWRARPESDRGIAEHYLRVEANWRLAKMRTTARDHNIAATLRAAVALLGAAADKT